MESIKILQDKDQAVRDLMNEGFDYWQIGVLETVLLIEFMENYGSWAEIDTRSYIEWLKKLDPKEWQCLFRVEISKIRI